MIVQSSADGKRRFIIDQVEHARLAGRFARAWGNDRFAPLHPLELMEHVVAHHDEGWKTVDRQLGRDPETGLPYHLTATPLAAAIETVSTSPDFNERHHPFCGLVASLHTYGLYCGRYGMTDPALIDLISDRDKPAVQKRLDGERRRQERLRAELAADRQTAPWVEPSALMRNYRLLQFFDAFSLYFTCVHEAARGPAHFDHVPGQPDDAVTIAIDRVKPGVYRVHPFPFRGTEIEVGFSGRWLTPQPPGTDIQALLADTPRHIESVVVTRGGNGATR